MPINQRQVRGGERKLQEIREDNRDGGERLDVERGGPDAEDEYDWKVEEQKPARGKGFQEDKEYSFRFRRMIWVQRDGRWGGKWRWTAWEHPKAWEERIEDGRERAMSAWDAVNIPQEVLLQIIESLVGSRIPLACEIEEVARAEGYLPPENRLGNFALVCRAWYTLIAPTLYSSLVVTDKLLGNPLRHSVAQHARRIEVQSDRPFLTSARLLRSAPRPSPALWLWWTAPYRRLGERAVTYQPSHSIIYAQLHRTYSNVIRLDMSDCVFLSSSDLLRLLASFSVLVRLDLRRVTVNRISHSSTRQGCPSASPTRYILAEDCSPPWLPFVTHCWTWPCKPSNHQAPQFNGLLPEEQRLVVHIIGLTTRSAASGRYGSYYLDAMDNDGRTWVLRLLVQIDTPIGIAPSLQVEFHTSQDDSRRSDAPRMHRCLFRVQDSDCVRTLTEDLTTFGDTLTQFTHLETVVLETGYKLEDDEIQLLLESLRKVCTVEVQHRTSEEAHQLALHAKKSPSHSASAELLSPFWCLQTYARRWDPRCAVYPWLSEEYWSSLKDEDKQGWDPCRPSATVPVGSK